MSDPSNPPPTNHSPIDLRLLLVCHAEEMQNRYANLAGADSGLTALGWKQTDLLAQWLSTHFRIDALITAPQLRNRLTAQRVGQAIGLPVTVYQSLAVELEPIAAAEAVVPGATAGNSGERAAGRDEIDAELCAVCEKLADKYRGCTVALFLNSTTIVATMSCLFAADSFDALLTHSSVSELQLRGDRWYLTSLDRHEHLPETVDPEVSLLPQAYAKPDIPEDLSRLSEIYGQNVAAAIEMQDQARRRRLDNLISFADIASGAQVLDVGAGAGLLTLALAESGDISVVGVDISPAMLERAEFFRLSSAPDVAKRVDFRLAAAQRLPFRNERFDTIICHMMLHLNRQPQRILKEVWRVLSPGGVLIVADLLSADDPVRRATQNAIEERRNPSHVAAHSASQYRELVTAAGFTVQTEEVVVFSRRLDGWLAELATDPADGAIVSEMVEASLETDAAGINARRQGDDILFDQRLVYLRAVKPSDKE